jgi:hypothetical protein
MLTRSSFDARRWRKQQSLSGAAKIFNRRKDGGFHVRDEARFRLDSYGSTELIRHRFRN